ncbi:MAG: DUF3089 domain-containing protein [Acidimicrobiales bacterium]
MTTPARSRRVAALVLAGALALGAGACSSDGSDGAAPTTTAAGASTTTVAPADDTAGGGTLERYADYETVSYDEPSHWVCRPDAPDDICHSDLDATRIDADGTLTVEPFEAADDPAIDCFYVYPTISRDEGTNSDWDASPNEEGYVTLNQAARLRSQCRLFAPVYRQITLTSLVGRLNGTGGDATEPAVDPFDDVLDAFRTYMAEDNDGRGFVLIGHSQGGGMLNQLIKTEIDPNDDVRAKLVGAYLVGSAVAVPEGEVVGGDFANVPLCSESGEVGCAMTWATFRSTAPPPEGSLFGYPRGGEGVAGCVSPAAPAGGSADLDAYFPKQGGASILTPEVPASDDRRWLDPAAGEIETPFVHLTDLVSGECTTQGNLPSRPPCTSIRAARGPTTSRATTPEWGLHLVDVNLVMGDIVEQVRQQAEAYGG